jgi:predicted amidohydrolase
MGADTVRVASAQYVIERFTQWKALEDHLSGWIGQAADNGAQLLLFPEYASLEMAGLTERRRGGERRSPDRHLMGPLPVDRLERRRAESLHWATTVIQPLVPRYLSLFSSLAARHAVYIMAGSVPIEHPDGSRTNRAFIFTPDGSMGWQDKMVLSRWEREVWHMTAGAEVRVFDTAFGPIGINICYDIEFPLVARSQAEARARIILSQCCCDSLRGYYRVRVGARARALENQAYVIQSVAMGDSSWLAGFGRIVGFAGIFGPPDLGPHESGIIAQSKKAEPQWVYATLDLKAIDRIRGDNMIGNQLEWSAHMRIARAATGRFTSVASSALEQRRRTKLPKVRLISSPNPELL